MQCHLDNGIDENSVRLFISSVANAAYSRDMCPVLWDITSSHYDRNSCKMVDSQLKEVLNDIAK